MDPRTAPEATPVGLQSHRVVLPTGITLHYIVKDTSPSAHRDGVDRAIVLLHGWTDSWRSFEEMLALLPFDETPVYAIDLRGHGQSSPSEYDAYALPDFAADIAAFLDVMRIEKAVLVGHSLGGLLTHQIAVDYPERVERLVIIAAGAAMVGNQALAEMREAVAVFPDDKPAPIDFVLAFQRSTFHHEPPPHVLYRYVSESLRVPGILWKEVLESLDREDHRALLPHIRVPSLILWGERDGVVNGNDQDELLRLLPDSSLVAFPEAGHALNVERAEAIVEALRTFSGGPARRLAA